MLLQKNSQRRSQSSTRIELARDLHDSLAQDLVAIGFQLDLLIEDLPFKYRNRTREIRLLVTDATQSVRKELFALRDIDSNYQNKLRSEAGNLELDIDGEISKLSPISRRIVDELVKNSATHSKGHQIKVAVTDNQISVSDDGQGLFGVGELVAELGGTMEVLTGATGTKVEIRLP